MQEMIFSRASLERLIRVKVTVNKTLTTCTLSARTTVVPLQYLSEVHIHHEHLKQGVETTRLTDVV